MFDKIRKMIRKNNTNVQGPNIVIILIDQFRNDARNSHPIFDLMAKKGVLFSEIITYAPYTVASCHATFTGMYGRENGVDAYTKSDNYDEKNCLSIAQYLKSAGYYTRAYTFSKILFPHEGIDHLNIISEDEESDITKSHLNELNICYSQKKPFFSFLHHGEIHHQVVKEVIKKYSINDDRYFGQAFKNRQRYLNYAKAAGDYLDRLIKHIEKNDPKGNTLVMVTTDHGSSVGEKLGEKAYGTFTYDYSIKVWLYLIWRQNFPKEVTIPWQVRTIDILPTLLDILGIQPDKRKKPVMGKSLLPLIQRQETGHRLSFSETGGVDGAYPSPDQPNVRCVRDGRWKLIQNTTTNRFELYDLANDPDEEDNLYEKEIDQAERLWESMIRYL